jgi:peroxiredoxin
MKHNRKPGRHSWTVLLAGHLQRRFILPVLVVALSLAPGLPTAAAGLKSGDAFPKTAVSDRQGKPVALPDDFKGQVVLIHFWASWCPFCIKEIRALESIYGIYKEKGLMPFSVNVGEDNQTIAAFLKNETVSYPILMDRNSEAAKQCGVTGLPMTFICDRNGVIKFKIIGEINKSGLERLLASLF